MNEKDRQNAIKIMEKLMEHPVTKLFHDFKNVENYDGLTSSKFPSLSIIKSRLQNNDFLNINEWKNQVELCWSNHTNFQEKNINYYSIVSNECKKIFEKLTNRMNLSSLEIWCSNVNYFQSIQLSYARQPPRKFFSITNQLDSFKKIDNKKIIPLSNSEIKAFMQANNMIKSDDISIGLANILTELQPEFKTANANELWVDLTKLDISTVRALQDYLKVELEKQGDHYPQL